MKISIVIPVYNEQGNIRTLYSRLRKHLKKMTSSYEIIFIDDGSVDASKDIIKELRARDRRIKLITFSRNFGHLAAVNAGLYYSSGEKVAIMDADLQDPPKVLVEMYKKSLEGFDVVYGIKSSRREGIVKNMLFNLFYDVFDALTKISMPKNAGTFSVVDRKVVKILNDLPEKNKFFSGLRAWAGFSQTGVEYRRPSRFAGRSKSLGGLINMALDGFLSFSYLPLRLASILGFIFAGIAFIAIVVVLFLRVFTNVGIVGWASTLIAVLLIGGVQLITLGIIGEYLGRIYDEVKNRPEYIISRKIGIR